uniref:Uncharacterized protein n=1 Tax=Aegilops tauschii subsp. strangulata TaxID=200361 RepID=A0A453SPU0_AEGTS
PPLVNTDSHPTVPGDKQERDWIERMRRPAFLEEMEPYVVAPYLRAYLHRFAASVSAASCDASKVGGGDVCRDEEAALRLKIVAVAAILVAGAAGVAIPLVGRRWRGGAAAGGGGSTFVLAKAFAAGVILATGFVHMMHDAEEKFQDPCLQDSPWRRFPFAGSIAMLASLVTLVVDFLGTQFYERKQREAAAAAATSAQEETAVALLEDGRNAGGEKREGAVHHGHGHGHGHENEAGPSQARQVVVSQVRTQSLPSIIVTNSYTVYVLVSLA